MTPSETLSPAPSYIGHVRNGIVVLDAQVSLVEGQAVRVEPLQAPSAEIGKLDAELSDRVQRLQQMFEEWTQEDRARRGSRKTLPNGSWPEHPHLPDHREGRKSHCCQDAGANTD